MKVTHIIIGLNVGGAELMLKRLVESHSSTPGIEHDIVSLTDLGVIGPELAAGGIKIYCLGMTSIAAFPKAFFKLRRLLKQLKPDVVQTWMYHSDFIGGIAARAIGIKNIYWNVRNTKLSGRGFFNLIFRLFCSLLSYFVPKSIVYVSNSAKNEHISLGYSKSKSVVIFNGFDVELLSFSESSRVCLRKEWGLNDGVFLISSIGRYAEAKDHLTFIKAVKKAMVRNDDIHAVLVGKGIKDNEILLSEIAGFNERFLLLDARSDISAVLSASDLFCLHSITEGFPNVLGEAMAVGRPCITTKAGDAELILNNQSMTFDVGDVENISNKILEVSLMSLQERLYLGSVNRKRIVDNYKLSDVADRYLELYRS